MVDLKAGHSEDRAAGEPSDRGLHGSGAVAFSTRGEYGVRFIALEQANVYDAQFAHLSACALSGATPVISAQRGAENIRVVQEIVKAARSQSR